MATRIRFYLPAVHRLPTAIRSRLSAWLRAAMDRARQRHKLAELDDRLLRDIGITAAQARDESGKSFWQGSSGE